MRNEVGELLANRPVFVPPLFAGTLVTPAGAAFDVYAEDAASVARAREEIDRYCAGTGTVKGLFFSPDFRLVPTGVRVVRRAAEDAELSRKLKDVYRFHCGEG